MHMTYLAVACFIFVCFAAYMTVGAALVALWHLHIEVYPHFAGRRRRRATPAPEDGIFAGLIWPLSFPAVVLGLTMQWLIHRISQGLSVRT